MLASANHDERNWTDPERYDIDRKEGSHLAFATGPHLCIGARLARYQARVAWRVLLERLPGLRLDPERPIEISGWEFRSPTTFTCNGTDRGLPGQAGRGTAEEPARRPRPLRRGHGDERPALNKAGHSLKDAGQRELFARDEEAWMDQFGLTDEERALLRARDWIGLWRHGMSIYVMVKLSRGDEHAAAGDRQADRRAEERMARVVGGIGASHAPSMEHIYDAGEEVRGSEEWQPLFGPFQQVAAWLEELRPDRLVVIYNDHMDEFFLDAYPTFALGVADVYPVADEGFGSRPFPPLPGDARLGWHIARSLVADEFDITICQELEVDHGVISPLPMVDFSEGEGGWKIPIVPLAVNVILHPLPSPLRCWKLGQALRRAVLSYAEDISVVVVGPAASRISSPGPASARSRPTGTRSSCGCSRASPSG